MFYNCGNMNLLHSEAAVKAARTNVATARFLGVESRILDRKETARRLPALNMSDAITHPVHGAMFHPPGGIVRHDAVVWGLARGALRQGAHIHQRTEALGIETKNGKVTGVKTNAGTIRTPRVLVSAGGYTAGLVHRLTGLKLPVSVLTIQAMVTQPLKPIFRHVVSSGAYHVYANQTLKGEIATGAHMDPWPNTTTRTSAGYIKHQAEALVDVPVPGRGEIHALVGGACGHDPGHGPDHGRQPAGGRVLYQLRMGLFRVQVVHGRGPLYGPLPGGKPVPGPAGALCPEPVRKPSADGGNRGAGTVYPR